MNKTCKYRQTCAYNCLHIEGIDNTKCESCKGESEYLHLGAVLYFIRIGYTPKMALKLASGVSEKNAIFDLRGYPKTTTTYLVTTASEVIDS